jgi:hypothetical protein
LHFRSENYPMFAIRFLTFCLALVVTALAVAKPPVRNMTVELRMVAATELDAVSPGTYAVRAQTQPDEGLDIQKLFVLNGERGQMRLSASVPQQWVKSVTGQGTKEAQGVKEAQGFESATVWMDAGQELSVMVNWPGGKSLATLDIAVDTAAMEQRNGQNLPSQLKNRFATQVVVPLGVWSTIAVTGKRQVPQTMGVYSTSALDTDQSKLVQVRVLAP